ncbi:MAG: hypothetical protein JRI61_09095 [Deltaproteobacteria bacterium]|nr:hypothetical protein [Deltaproteobacteria bacterium]
MKQVFFSSIFFLVFVSSCTGIHNKLFESSKEKSEPFLQGKAFSIISAIQKRNNSILTFKGLGKIDLNNNGESLKARAAWIGSYPNQLRFEILGIGGHPLLSFSFDNDQQFFISHTDKTFYHRQDTDADLEDLIAMPIKLNDIMKLLTGRIPVYEHFDFEVIEDTSGSGWILVLKSEWTGVCEKLYLDEKKTKIYKIELFGFTGGLTYRAVFDGGMTIEGMEVPSKLILTDGDGASVTLRIDRYLKNIPVSSSVFILEPPPGDN